ncbi:16166_t:CDS:2 [Funneliformis mosseae]|uniref:16166_t:CDS:1 n=1 Tax=Funneliformis mosseae TaxID=27381 RepID=A0A9N9EQA5_FUNMO|nr:16166_t:CDS:2 [Funneliformis mosseae]
MRLAALSDNDANDLEKIYEEPTKMPPGDHQLQSPSHRGGISSDIGRGVPLPSRLYLEFVLA